MDTKPPTIIRHPLLDGCLFVVVVAFAVPIGLFIVVATTSW